MSEPINEEQQQPTPESEPRRAGALAQTVSNHILKQEATRDSEAAWTAANEEPAFDKRKGESNFGRRVFGKIALASAQP